jgi:putative heme-binding domain-containing protein
MLLWSPAATVAATLLLAQAPPQMRDMSASVANPYQSPADIEQGRKLYGGRCAGCHGPSGDGGKGANLALPVLPRSRTDRELYRVLRYGLPETEMPGSSQMTDREIWQLAAFVRTLGRLSAEKSTGDAARGREIVHGAKAGCLRCHSIGTSGEGAIGPALTDTGSRRSPAYLRDRLTNPAAGVPDTFRIVQLETRSGAKVNGVRIAEDTWSIQLRDFGNRLHSYWKQDLANLKVEKRTPMPSYKTQWTPGELEDVVAYLSSLRGLEEVSQR